MNATWWRLLVKTDKPIRHSICFGAIQNVQVGPKSLARECLVGFNIVHVNVSNNYLRSVKPVRFELAQVLCKSILKLRMGLGSIEWVLLAEHILTSKVRTYCMV